jgi:hypothetical protein
MATALAMAFRKSLISAVAIQKLKLTVIECLQGFLQEKDSTGTSPRFIATLLNGEI